MTPKEKAFELYKMYNNILIEDIIDRRPTYLVMTHKMAKKSALIAVDEIIKSFYLNTGSDIIGNHVINFAIRESDYWQEVKKEIEKL